MEGLAQGFLNNTLGALTNIGRNNNAVGGVGTGNNNLNAAFDRAIAEAQKTLITTTIKGAHLYSLKQQVR